MEALAQEHFNYIAEGGFSAGPDLGAPPSPRSRPTRSRLQQWLRWSPQVAVRLVAAVATVVLARHLREYLVDFTREAFSVEGGGGEDRGRGGGAELNIQR